MKKIKNKIVVVIAAYNEEQKIAGVLKRVSKFCDKIVVVNDGSKDNTLKKIKGRKIIALNHIINLGQGAALQTGFEYAKTLNPEVVVTFDADGQFDPREILKMVNPILKKRADVTLGSRFLGSVKNIPFIRLVILRMGIFFTYLFSNIALTDTHNGFRAFSKNAISKIKIIHNRWAHPSDILYQIARNNFKFVEIPIKVLYSDYSKKKGQRNIEAIRIPLSLIIKALFN